ncbi:hypothetical protein DICVIV_04272 [Dictyocaulus viviparus]|uniref:Uncharacterized protein n=1 Tax=Dictyocaulus viviparus TaxID=29172 RepID=A0A0D8XYN9_DICVI|nr:hypothetical protein DICVIV_04272 [Dictyocaulus viviparus]
MWHISGLICSPFYRILTVCFPVHRGGTSTNHYQVSSQKAVNVCDTPLVSSKANIQQPHIKSAADVQQYGMIRTILEYDFSQNKVRYMK